MFKLLEKLPQIEAKLAKKRFLFIGTDYDGTLTPIVRYPDYALLPQETRSVLRDLSDMRNALVCIISGRSYKDIRKKVGIRKIIYAGNHGLEIKTLRFRKKDNLPGFIKDSKKYKEEIKIICRSLKRRLKGLKGVWVENKGITASIHYRLANFKDAHKAKSIVFSSMPDFKNLKLVKGKKVWEIRPNLNWDKGKAIKYVLEQNLTKSWRKKTAVVYAGDDKTDEDAFSFLKQGGVTILIRKNPSPKSKAQYFLKDQKEVIKFLRWLKCLWEKKVAESK